MPGLIQALCWSKAALHCPSTSAWKWLDGKTPPRAFVHTERTWRPLTFSVIHTILFIATVFLSSV